MAVELILGGARSGKSRLAEARAVELGLAVNYIATARHSDDAEMQARIEHHQQRRPSEWAVIEEPIELPAILQKIDNEQACVVVDCLTLWLTNVLLENNESLLETHIKALIKTLPTLKAQVILVSNEVGHGIVPLGELNRRFVDESGRLHQQIAEVANRVDFVMAGLPMRLK